MDGDYALADKLIGDLTDNAVFCETLKGLTFEDPHPHHKFKNTIESLKISGPAARRLESAYGESFKTINVPTVSPSLARLLGVIACSGHRCDDEYYDMFFKLLCERIGAA